MARRTALAVASAAVVAPLAVLGVAALRVHLVGRRAVASPSTGGGTVVVLGAWAHAEGPGTLLRRRLEHAIDLYRGGGPQRLAMAGGVPPHEDEVSGGRDEVAAMTQFARLHGVPTDDILELRLGQNTREQIASTRRLVVEAGLGPVTVVSSSYHLARVRAEARRQGFDVTVSAPPHSPDQDQPRLYLAHLFTDTLALVWYALPPAVSARIDTSAGTFRHLGVMALTGDVDWATALRSLRRSRGDA